MSVSKNTYVIYGYDVSEMRDELWTDELKWSKLGEQMTCYQRPGKVQFFDDPMSGDYLYIGYIVGKIEGDYSDQCFKINTANAEMYRAMVDKQLEDWGIRVGGSEFELIVFNEFT